jgi:hypothetical protein
VKSIITSNTHTCPHAPVQFKRYLDESLAATEMYEIEAAEVVLLEADVLSLEDSIAKLERNEQRIIDAYGEQHYARECAEAKLRGAADWSATLEALSDAKHNFEQKWRLSLAEIARREAALATVEGHAGLPLSREVAAELTLVLGKWCFTSGSAVAAAAGGSKAKPEVLLLSARQSVVSPPMSDGSSSPAKSEGSSL